MVNAFPEWSDARSDEQSLAFQLTNIMGEPLQKLDEQLLRMGRNYFLTTANLDEIDLVYRYELPLSFQFQTDETDSAFIVNTAPTVSGKIGDAWYTVSGTIKNDIESFWYDSIPNRISSTVTESGNHIVLSGVNLDTTPFTAFDNDPHIPGRLLVTISGGSQFLAIENDQPARGLVILEGVTRRGTEESETLVFLYNDTKQTVKEWKELTSASVFGVSPDTAVLSVRSAEFNFGPYRDFYNLEWSVGNEKVDTFWDVGVSEQGIYTLNQVRYVSDQFDNLLAGLTDKEVTGSTEVLTTSGTTFIPLDLAVQPFSNRAWICSSSRLFLFDTDMYYPSMRQMAKKQYDSITSIDPDSYHKVLNDEIELSYLFRRPIKEVARHRVSVKNPSGTRNGIVNSTLVSITSDFWRYGQIDEREMSKPDILQLSIRGDYVFTMETIFIDGTNAIDEIIVSVESKEALAEFNLDFTAVGLSFDSDQKLWILDNTGIKHRIDLAYDVMLIDYDQKIIYFREQYEDVEVIA